MNGDRPEQRRMLLESTARVPDHVVYRPFAAETVLLNLQTGQYHGVNPSGGRMLEVLEQVGTLKEAARRLAEEFDQPTEQVERDLASFCEGLADRGLVELHPSDD